MVHMIFHTLEEILLILPVLYFSYVFIEMFERKHNRKENIYKMLNKFGPVCGALVGAIPQCGFSVVASVLYMKKYLTLGTLLAIFISSSDESTFLLLSHLSLYKDMIGIILIKMSVGCIVGYGIDYLFNQNVTSQSNEYIKNITIYEECTCNQNNFSLYKSTFYKTIKTFFYVFVLTYLFNVFLHENEDLFTLFLRSYNGNYDFIVASIVGFIPGCFTSIALTQLYIIDAISFCALTSGLMSHTGLGVVMLLRFGVDKTVFLKIVFVILMTSLFTGYFIRFIL